jgi:hypothetical protein
VIQVPLRGIGGCSSLLIPFSPNCRKVRHQDNMHYSVGLKILFSQVDRDLSLFTGLSMH